MTLASRLSKADKRRYRWRAFDRARLLYQLLIRLVGGPNPRCAWCGRDEHQTQLTLDHVEGKTWRANELRMDARVRRYRAEFLRGVPLRVLCRECNSKDGADRKANDRVHGVWTSYGSVRVICGRIERETYEPEVPF